MTRRSMGNYKLKERGHELIDELRILGMGMSGRRGIYGRLRRRLKVVEGKEHFANMHHDWEMERAIRELEYMLACRKIKKGLLPKEKRPKVEPLLPNMTLPRVDRLRALEALKKDRIVWPDGRVWIVRA